MAGAELLAKVSLSLGIDGRFLYFMDKDTIGFRGIPLLINPPIVSSGLDISSNLKRMNQAFRFITNPSTSFRGDIQVEGEARTALHEMMRIAKKFKEHDLPEPGFILPQQVPIISPGKISNTTERNDMFSLNIKKTIFNPPLYENLPVVPDNWGKACKRMDITLKSLVGRPHVHNIKFMVE